jgi:tetratricopeptide (TPR) repeat protein
MCRLTLWFFLTAVLGLAQAPQPEVYSPLGRAFYARSDAKDAIANADAALAKAPGSADLLLEAARVRDAALRFGESIPLYTRGMDAFPEDARFPRFRGHRFISTRKFDLAIMDLKKAASLAPASFDVSYHLGLAYYLRGDYGHAAREYQRCLAMASQPRPEFMKGMPAQWRPCYALSDDSRAAVTDWAWRALIRSAKADEAKALLATIADGMEVKENRSYYQDLLLYKGLRTVEQILPASSEGNAFPTTGYAVGLWQWTQGRKEEACRMWRRVVEEPAWSAFGFIAAEQELARGGCGSGKKR